MISSDILSGSELKVKKVRGSRNKFRFTAKIDDSITSPTTQVDRNLLDSISSSKTVDFGSVLLNNKNGSGDTDLISTKEFKAKYSNNTFTGSFKIASNKKHLGALKNAGLHKKHGFEDDDGVINDRSSKLALTRNGNSTASIWSALSWAKPTKVSVINNTDSRLTLVPATSDGKGGDIGDLLGGLTVALAGYGCFAATAGFGSVFCAGVTVGGVGLMGKWLVNSVFPDYSNVVPNVSEQLSLEPGGRAQFKNTDARFGFSNGAKDVNLIALYEADAIIGGKSSKTNLLLGLWGFDNPNIGSPKAYYAKPEDKGGGKNYTPYLKPSDPIKYVQSDVVDGINTMTEYFGDVYDYDDNKNYKTWDLNFNGTTQIVAPGLL